MITLLKEVCGAMAGLHGMVQRALNENRILTLGTQVLLGFQTRVVFEQRFDDLPEAGRRLSVVGLVLLIVALGLLILPGVYHRVVFRGEDSPSIVRLPDTLMKVVLPMLVLAIALELGIAASMVLQPAGAILLGFLLATSGCLYLAALHVKGRGRQRHVPEGDGHTPVDQKIEHVLTEMRVILPGAQALLGFLLVTMFTESFEELPRSVRLVHLVSLCLVAVATLLLMAPAARHRIVEKGESTDRFQRSAGRFLLAALVPLGLGLAGSLYVVTFKVTESAPLAVALAVAVALFLFGLWFGYTLWMRWLHGSD